MTSKYIPNTVENLLKSTSPIDLYHVLSIKKRKEYIKNLKEEIIKSIIDAETYSRKYPNAHKLNFIIKKEINEDINKNIEEIATNIININLILDEQKKQMDENKKYIDDQRREIDEQIKIIKEYNNLHKEKLDKFIIKNK